ncbi:Fic family protein [Undibacterium amnicola]|uniref:Fic family protein n=1 Tax=Undibacterium amnicola TaxID=1834038 RepID=A0ABR6XQS3_9BURK|nr:Fic family protein [Undibacterium amnicola]MBC3831835.1 Fic family protein [Undibacterium amnicola]
MNIKETLNEVDRVQLEIDTVRPISSEQEARVFQKFRLEWNYHSNAIEGNSLTYGETRAFIMHGLTAKGKPFKDYLDIRGHNQVIDVLVDFIRNKEDLTEADIREIHKILLVEPYESYSISHNGLRTTRQIEIGKYKTTANHVLTSTGETYFFASPEETPSKMADLVRWFREERELKRLHPVTLAASFHYQFVAIHPFDDGNGRMARILMNLILMQLGYLPVVLKLEKKSEYFLALQKADAGEIDEFVIFVAEALIESGNIFMKAARGEPIDELGDFDKKIYLLRQAIETESGGSEDQKTQEKQNFLVSGMVSSIFEGVGSRFVQIDPLFALKKLHIIYQNEGKTGIIKDKPIHQLVEQLITESSTKPLTTIQLFYHAQGFIKNSSESFLLSIVIYFNLNNFSISFQTTGTLELEIFRAGYSTFPDDTDVLRVTKVILDSVVGGLEKLANKKSN